MVYFVVMLLCAAAMLFFLTHKLYAGSLLLGIALLAFVLLPAEISRPHVKAWSAVYEASETPTFTTPAGVKRQMEALHVYCKDEASKDAQAKERIVAFGALFARTYLPGEKDSVLSLPAVQQTLAFCAKEAGAVVPAPHMDIPTQ